MLHFLAQQKQSQLAQVTQGVLLEQLEVTDLLEPLELVRLLDFGFGPVVEQTEKVEPQLLEERLVVVRQGHFLLEQLEGLPAQHFLLVE